MLSPVDLSWGSTVLGLNQVLISLELGEASSH